MKKILPFLIIVGVLVAFYFLTSKKPTSNIISASNPNTDLILFYGNTCPHCKIVEEFISTNEIDQKLKISQLEVYDDKSNSALFSNLVQEICQDQLNSEGLPVPFLIDQSDKKCIIGDTPITDYLTEKTK